MKNTTCLLILLMFTFGCERDLSGPTKDIDGLHIATEEDAFHIINRTDEELHLFLVEQGIAAVIEWAPYCMATGTVLQPAEEIRIAFDNIYGYKPDCAVIVHWWSCIEQDGVREPGPIRSIVLPTSSDS
ncbi:hypothetical protein JXA02_09480 [candidate division KSB1 bacterium]|nr:hypothetical protein [candidate division KSB1 bacterium]RQW04440.1 MAG: hypothetical protein EH222_11245 [candidate division KSB1 bacterium]